MSSLCARYLIPGKCDRSSNVTSESYFPLTVAACVNPHCVHIFRAMQVTTGMHSIRAFKAEKHPNSNIKMGGGSSEEVGSAAQADAHYTDFNKRAGFRRNVC